jgi:hypothetical protein
MGNKILSAGRKRTVRRSRKEQFMEAGITKTASRRRKAMRVATVFTGAAAAAVTFAPTAMADTGQVAQPAGRTMALRPLDRRGPVYGSIKEAASCGNTPHWVHLDGWDPNGITGGSFRTACFGFKGLYDMSSGIAGHPWLVTAECGGNNHGFLNYNYANAQSFNVGTYYRNEHSLSMNSVFIGGWAGNDTCPKSGHH